VILSLSCHVGWILNGRLVVQVLTLCLSLYSSAGTNGTRAAAQATCTQTIAEFCRDFGEINNEKELMPDDNLEHVSLQENPHTRVKTKRRAVRTTSTTTPSPSSSSYRQSWRTCSSNNREKDCSGARPTSPLLRMSKTAKIEEVLVRKLNQ
jgi:hypothetical protein